MSRMGSVFKSLAFTAALLSLAACPGPQVTCEDQTCSGHGTCDDSSGTPVCTCKEGWTGGSCGACAQGLQDHDGDGTCSPDCASANLACGAHGSCSDTLGTAACTCDAGYAGELCDGCAAGFQDKDGNDTCSPDCATANLACVHGHCSDTLGTAACACDEGYAGALCDGCATGFQDNGGGGICLPGCGLASLDCGTHGACNDQSGTAVCACDEGYAGAACAECAAGYQDHDGDQTCLPDCATAALACGTQQLCDDGSGTAQCVCAAGYQDHDDDGTCLADCATANLSCGAHGQCDDADGTADCACDTGYQGTTCAECATGYQDNDHNGSCLVDCATSALDCGDHGACSDTDGTAGCTCDTGYQGATCAQCASGYVSDGAGGCIFAPSGHTCSTAIPLALVNGTVTGSTVGAGDNHAPSCLSSSSSDSSELVYVLNPSVDMHVILETSANYDTVLSLTSNCSGQDLVCNDDIVASQDTNSKIEYDLVAGTTYYALVDGYGETGTFSLTVTVSINCAAGQVPDAQGDCVDDPCDPDPCLAAANTLCVAQLPGAYQCNCKPGYIDDGAGGCMQDPNGNRWTFMVYVNGDNNLADDAVDDIAEMATAGSTNYVNIIVLHDGGSSGDTRMLRVIQGGTTVLQNKGELDMGDWQTLRDFGVWAVQNYPAQHFALVMWDHGDGWRSATSRPSGTLKAFSNDDHGSEDGISISNGDYAKALAAITQAAGGKLDLVGFDACLMGMYEVAKATEPYANYLVASEETEPNIGWAYDRFLPQLVGNYNMDAAALGKLIIDGYYAESTDDSTLALSNLSTIPALDSALTAFANALLADSAQYSKISTVREATLSFDDDTHLDLRDFASRIAVMSLAPTALVSSANALVTQLQSTVVYNKAQTSYSKAYGLAIYLPSRSSYYSSYDPAYNDVGATWSTATTWDEFLQDFVP